MSISAISASHHTAYAAALQVQTQPTRPGQPAPVDAMPASATSDVITDILSQLTATDVSQLGQFLINSGAGATGPRPQAAATE